MMPEIKDEIKSTPLCGEDTGDCIHCYMYRGLRLCSLTDMVCVGNDMDHCINFGGVNER